MKAYLSSTYADLEKYRRRAYQELRNLGFDVLAMEDYGAADERPIDRCLADVERSDLYVGIFAHRYGFIPDAENPERRSITELEYRHAVDKNIPRLIFQVPADAKWERKFDDAITGEGDRGKRISNLREELAKNRLLKEFATPDELSAAVASGASRWLRDRQEISSTRVNPSQPAAPHPRELLFDLLILHAPSDGDSAAALAEALPWKVTRSETGLVAASTDDLKDLDRLAASARSAAVLLSPSALTILAEDPERSRRALGLARDRTGELFAVALEKVSSDVTDAWELSSVIGPAPATDGHGSSSLAYRLNLALAERLPDLEVPLVGLPVVFVAMTATEAASLLADPPEPVGALLDRADGSKATWAARYGQTRSAWRPFAGVGETIEQVLSAAVARVNQDANRLRGRTIRLQPYRLDALMQDLDMWPIYRDIARRGCLVVVDELSLFHPGVRQAFVGSPLRDGDQVAFVTLSPFDPTVGSPLAGIREQLDEYLVQAARRFGEVFDPLCEMGVPERRRLDRWLYRSLPRAVEVLREARQDLEKLQEFSEELDRQPNPALGRLMAGEGGPT
jgi:hypothetical protein